MGFWLFLPFILLPIAEIATFIVVGGWIGVLPTIGLVILAAFLGMTVIRRQGMQALDRLQATMDAGRDPGPQIAHGALKVIAGILLILPGFLTDIVGLLLLVPPIRAALIRSGAARSTVRVATYVRRGQPRGPAASPPADPNVIDVEFEDIEDGSAPRRPGTSGWTRPRQ